MPPTSSTNYLSSLSAFLNYGVDGRREYPKTWDQPGPRIGKRELQDATDEAHSPRASPTGNAGFYLWLVILDV